jgi:hypothetical protein
MAHFAEVENGFVKQVVVVNNDVITDDNGIEQESLGQQFLSELIGGIWVQCSYSGNPIAGQYRGPYPGIGWTWDGNMFVDPSQSSE